MSKETIVFLGHSTVYERHIRLLKKRDINVVTFYNGAEASKYLKDYNVALFIVGGMLVNDGFSWFFLMDAIRLFRSHIAKTLFLTDYEQAIDDSIDFPPVDGLDLMLPRTSTDQEFTRTVNFLMSK